MWFLLSIIAGFLFASNKLIFRRVFSKDVDPIPFFGVHDLLAGLLLLPVALFYVSYPKSGLTWACFVGALLFLFFADLFAALSLKSTEASLYQITVQIRNVVTLIGGFIFFSEAITYLKFVSIVLIMLGAVVAIKGSSRYKIDKGIVYAFISGVSIAIAFLFIKEVTKDVNAIFIASVGLMFSGLLGLALVKLRKQKYGFSVLKDHYKPLIIAAIIFAVFEAVQLTAIGIGQASKVTPVSQSSMVFALIGGYVFLNERSRIKSKLLGSSLIVLGIVLLII